MTKDKVKQVFSVLNRLRHAVAAVVAVPVLLLLNRAGVQFTDLTGLQLVIDAAIAGGIFKLFPRYAKDIQDAEGQ